MSGKKNELMVGGEAFDSANAANYLEQVNAAIKGIKGVEEEDESIAGKNLAPFGELKNIKDTTSLIQAYSSVKGRMDAYNAAASDMGLNKKDIPAFKIEGVSGDVWLNAIIRQEKIVTSADKLAKLEKVKGLFTEMLSKEDKAKAQMKELSDVLADLGA
jgi:hypothetical protein